ncbi:unnamed protein product [Eretmochelys imbricata]
MLPCTLPAPRLFLDRLSARQGDKAMVSCLVPLDAPMTCIVFCKDGKEISVQPKGGNTIVYDSPYTVSKESAGAFSCLSQLKDDNNQENNSLPSDPWDLHMDDGEGSAAERPDQRATTFLSLRHYEAERERRHLDPQEADAAVELPDFGVITASPHDPAAGPMASLSPGTLPAPRLFLDRLSSHQGDTAMLSCLVPCGIPVTRIIFCKDGKEISVQPKGGNTVVYDSPYAVSKESAGAFSCLYQLKDDNNQENNSLPSDPRYLHVDGGDGSGGDASPQGVALATLQNRYRHSLRVYTQHTPTEAVVLPVEETMSPNNWWTGQRDREEPSASQGLGPIVGLAIMAGLALALLGCFLMKTGCVALQDSQGNLAQTGAARLLKIRSTSAQPNDKLTGAVGHGQERDWLEPGSFCHKLQGAIPTTPTGCGSQPMGAAELALGAGAACGAPWLPLCIGVIGGTCHFFQMLHGARAFQAKTRHLTTLSNTDTVVTGARADQAQNGRGCCSDVRGGRKGSLSSAGHPDGSVALGIPSAPQACMSPTLAASLIGAPGKEMVMEPVNQPARTSVWVNR